MAGQKIYSTSGSKNKAPAKAKAPAPSKAVLIKASTMPRMQGTNSGGGTGQAGKSASQSKYRS